MPNPKKKFIAKYPQKTRAKTKHCGYGVQESFNSLSTTTPFRKSRKISSDSKIYRFSLRKYLQHFDVYSLLNQKI
jgi:hypothetical protein